jgi:hypothetical protein
MIFPGDLYKTNCNGYLEKVYSVQPMFLSFISDSYFHFVVEPALSVPKDSILLYLGIYMLDSKEEKIISGCHTWLVNGNICIRNDIHIMNCMVKI